VTDVIMPGMNGAALAKQVRSLRRKRNTLHHRVQWRFYRADMLTQGVSFIQRPFTPTDLGRKLRRLLVKPQGTSAFSGVCQRISNGFLALSTGIENFTRGQGDVTPRQVCEGPWAYDFSHDVRISRVE
jgi:DNA-binding response OmpR family regulator